MIKIKEINLSIHPFQLKTVGNNTDLTTGQSEYLNEPSDGGIIVTPTLEINDIEKGRFFITQVCASHHLEILTEENKHFVFDSIEKLKDTHLPSDNHYKYYPIVDSQTKDESAGKNEDVVFWDAPFIELCHNWMNVVYKICFKTYFQYQRNTATIKPIASFTWSLECEVKRKENIWDFVSNKHSTEEEIRRSILHYSENDKFLDTSSMKQIREEVKKFNLSSGLIKNCC